MRAISCSDDRFGLASGVRFQATAGKTYFLLVGRCCSNSGGGGGPLVLTASRVVDVPLQFSMDVTGASVEEATGFATITGTVAAWATPSVGERASTKSSSLWLARGFVFVQIACTPGFVQQWTVEVDTDTGIAFGPGAAVLRTFIEFGTDGFRDFIEDRDVPDLAFDARLIRLGRKAS